VDYALPYFSLCLVTTLLATILIVFRIFWLTRHQSGSAFSGYRAVIEMIVESALLYSVTLIVYIALLFGPDTDNNDGYAQAILIHMTVRSPFLA
jgi:ABC-type spermidine/putrescine transport system permease subunit II